MDILLGMSILLALLVFVFLVLCGYASVVDRIALFLHRHAEEVRRMHATYDEQIQSWWQAEWRRGRPAMQRGPVPIHKERRRDHQRGVAVGDTR